jgi:hypothetical protein
MDGFSNQIFSGSTLSLNQHGRGITLSDLLNNFENPCHLFAYSNDILFLDRHLHPSLSQTIIPLAPL